MNGAMLIPEFDQEMTNARKMLESISDEHLDYRPHPKSWTMRQLASHLGNVLGWTDPTFHLDELDLAQPFEQSMPANKAEILAHFEQALGRARATLEGASSETFQEPWTLKSGDRTHFTMPKGVVFRFFVLNHVIHHRAQLAVYLRLCDLTVPGMYGPSADETIQGIGL